MPKLEPEIIEAAARELADDIDFQVMRELLLESGWSEAVLKPMTWEQSAEIDIWTSQNIKKGFYTRGLVWLFKDAKEATWFRLKWYE